MTKNNSVANKMKELTFCDALLPKLMSSEITTKIDERK